jgi:hypothetical protein
MSLPPDQGRARGLYDEQLQRVQQEKMLCEAGRPILFRRDSAPAQSDTEETKTGAD